MRDAAEVFEVYIFARWPSVQFIIRQRIQLYSYSKQVVHYVNGKENLLAHSNLERRQTSTNSETQIEI